MVDLISNSTEALLFWMNQSMRSELSDSSDWRIPYNTTDVRNGRAYFKLVRDGAVVAFIDKLTGDIFKPASWAAPAKGVRGNVLSEFGGQEAFCDLGVNGLKVVRYAR